jgi:thiamine kinase-like enzyme
MWIAYAKAKGYSRVPILDGLGDVIPKLESAAGPLGEDPPPKFCHFDLLADNFVIRASGGVALVDFEYCAPGQPLMDLAVLAMGCNLNDTEEYNLLSSFLGSDANDDQAYSFKALRVLAGLRETFWGVTAEISGSSSLTMQEACAYVDMNYIKFKGLLTRFESLTPPCTSSPTAVLAP